MLERIKKHKRFVLLFSLYIAFLWYLSFSRSVLPTHFLAEKITFSQMTIGLFLTFIGHLIFLIFVKKSFAKLSWILAPIIMLVYVLMVIKIFSPLQFFLASLITGSTLFFFFIPYNIAHFETTPKHRTGLSSALMFSVGPLIGVVGPVFAGYMLQLYSLLFWILCAVFAFIVVYFALLQVNFKINYSVKAALSEIKATRFFVFLGGFWDAFNYAIIGVYSLYFIKSPAEYGIFLAYLSFIAVIANLTLGGLTDKFQRRSFLLYPTIIGLGILTLLFTKATADFRLWIILASLIQCLLPIYWSLTTTLVVDHHPNLYLAIPGREIVLALGRITGLFFVFLSFSFEKKPFYIFFILAGALFLFALNLVWQTKIKKNYSFK